MRIFGIVVSFKRARRWTTREEFEELSRVVLSLSEDTRSALNGVEAGRKRLERHIGKDNGKEEAVVEEKVRQPVRINPGDILSPEEVASLEGR